MRGLIMIKKQMSCMFRLSVRNRPPIVNCLKIIYSCVCVASASWVLPSCTRASFPVSDEHTSELQSQFHLVCRLLLEKKIHSKGKRRRFIMIPIPSAEWSARFHY